MPAAFGFHQSNRIRLNPSYIIVSAYKTFSHYFKGPWQRLVEDGRWLIEASLLTDLNLPSDWVTLDPMSGQIEGSLEFSSEAIRVWLYHAMDGGDDFLGFKHWEDYYNSHGYFPLKFDGRLLRFEGKALPGYWAASARVLWQKGRLKEAIELWKKAKQLIHDEPANYYSSALYLLSIPKDEDILLGGLK